MNLKVSSILPFFLSALYAVSTPEATADVFSNATWIYESIHAVLGYVNDAKESKYISEARAIYIVVQTEEAKFRAENGLNTKSTITYGDDEAVTAPTGSNAGAGTMKKSDLVKTIQDKTEFTNVDITKNGTKYTLKWHSDKDVEAELTTNKDVKIK